MQQLCVSAVGAARRAARSCSNRRTAGTRPSRDRSGRRRCNSPAVGAVVRHDGADVERLPHGVGIEVPTLRGTTLDGHEWWLRTAGGCVVAVGEWRSRSGRCRGPLRQAAAGAAVEESCAICTTRGGDDDEHRAAGSDAEALRGAVVWVHNGHASPAGQVDVGQMKWPASSRSTTSSPCISRRSTSTSATCSTACAVVRDQKVGGQVRLAEHLRDNRALDAVESTPASGSAANGPPRRRGS